MTDLMADLTVDDLSVTTAIANTIDSIALKPLREWLTCPDCQGRGWLVGPVDLAGEVNERAECSRCGGSGLDPNKVMFLNAHYTFTSAHPHLLTPDPRCDKLPDSDHSQCGWVPRIAPIRGNDE